jgi:hypothetical protein
MAKQKLEATVNAEETKGAAPKVQKKKTFSLNDYKSENNLDKNARYKEQKWIPLSPAFQEITGIPGIPLGHIVLARGGSNTSKTTCMLEAAISAQAQGILPVFIITEMKWNWEHAKLMGLQIEEKYDEKTGELLSIDGDFLYTDRDQVKSIEGVAQFINKLLDDQQKGKLPYDLLFLWDSVGSIPCEMSIEKGKNNNEWNAGAMSAQFGNHVNQRVIASRKYDYPFTNTLFCVNKVWVQKPANVMAQPTMQCKGGTTMFFDSSLVFTFGNVSTAGVSFIKAVKNGKEITFASRVNIKVEKNHVNGISTGGKIIVTPTGYILDDKKELEQYKKDHMDYFYKTLGEGDGDINTVEESGDETLEQYTSEPVED